MKVHVEDYWQRNSLALWVIEDSIGGKRRVLRIVGAPAPGDVAVQWVEFDPYTNTAQVEPTLILPREIAEAIIKELGDYMPPSAAQGEHLKDAITTRDRLLTLIEKGADIG